MDGRTNPCFSALGKMPLASEVFIIVAIEALRSSTFRLSMAAGTGSRVHDFPGAFMISSETKDSDTWLNSRNVD